MAQMRRLTRKGNNLRITFACSFAIELQIDQGITHDGVCLVVVSLEEGGYAVIAAQETLDHSNLGLLQMDDYVNVERSMMLGGRLDDHTVQGYVDQTVRCTAIREIGGSYYFTFVYEVDREVMCQGYITVEKGSVTVSDVSLTVYNSQKSSFEVTIIPHTLEYTNFEYSKEESMVSLEFNVLGKYIAHLRSFD